MPSFTTPTFRTPFGQNEYLRSTRGRAYESYMCYKDSVPAVTLDGDATQKILQPGVIIAAITSGGGIGKYGPYQPGGVVTESASIAVDAGGGTFTITVEGATTAAIAFNATALAVQTALELLPGITPLDLTVSGGPGAAGGATPYVIQWNPFGPYGGLNAPTVTTGAGSLTGGAGTAAVSTTGGGLTSPATDGRGDPLNIVGINDTFLPWQLRERDVELGVLYAGHVVQSRVLEQNGSGLYVPVSDATVAAMMRNKRTHAITWH